LLLLSAFNSSAQLLDRTKSPNPINEGIAKSLDEEIGPGRGDVNTPDSSAFIIMRDPFRAIRRLHQTHGSVQRSEGSGIITCARPVRATVNRCPGHSIAPRILPLFSA